MDMTCNKGPWLVLSQRGCGYVVRTVTLWLRGYSILIFFLIVDQFGILQAGKEHMELDQVAHSAMGKGQLLSLFGLTVNKYTSCSSDVFLTK